MQYDRLHFKLFNKTKVCFTVFLYIPYWMGVEGKDGLVSVFVFCSMFQTSLYFPDNQMKMKNKNLYCNKNLFDTTFHIDTLKSQLSIFLQFVYMYLPVQCRYEDIYRQEKSLSDLVHSVPLNKVHFPIKILKF